jgi:hypothetical protein
MEKIDKKTELWRYNRLEKSEDFVTLSEEYIN